MKYKVGDIVRVKEEKDLREASMTRDVYVSSEMFEYAGKLATICRVDTDNCTYLIEEDDKTHIWISEFFEDEDENKEEKSDEYEYIIDKVLSEMTEETKDTLIKQFIKGENKITITASPIYKTINRTNGVSVQQIVGTKYGVAIINKDGMVKL